MNGCLCTLWFKARLKINNCAFKCWQTLIFYSTFSAGGSLHWRHVNDVHTRFLKTMSAINIVRAACMSTSNIQFLSKNRGITNYFWFVISSVHRRSFTSFAAAKTARPSRLPEPKTPHSYAVLWPPEGPIPQLQETKADVEAPSRLGSAPEPADWPRRPHGIEFWPMEFQPIGSCC